MTSCLLIEFEKPLPSLINDSITCKRKVL